MTSAIDHYLVVLQEKTDRSGIYAYRGQPNAGWLLQSGATRRLVEEYGRSITQDPEFAELYIDFHRDTLLEPARARGYGVDSGRTLSDLELLAKLQHLGAATGLLDFSWSPLVALWFACHDPDNDGKLFMVNTNDAVSVVRLTNDIAADGLRAVLTGARSSARISYWEPAAGGEAAHRIVRQRSVFIIGGPLVGDDDRMVSGLLIPKHDKKQLLAELAVLDFHHESLFFDVYGFAQASQWRRVPDLTADAHTRRANRFYQRGEFEEAVAHYDKAIQLVPANALTYFLRGNALAGCDRHREAVNDYDQVVDQIGSSDLIEQSIVYSNRGNSKATLEDYHGAIADYTNAINIVPDHPEYRYNRGNAYSDISEFAKAIEDYELVKGLSAGHAAFNKGNAYLSMGLLAEATRSYRLADEQGYDHNALNQNLGTLGELSLLIDATEFGVNPSSNRDKNRIVLQVLVPGQQAGQILETRRFLIYGRGGNSGNTGGPGLAGGTGALGNPLTIVEVQFQIAVSA